MTSAHGAEERIPDEPGSVEARAFAARGAPHFWWDAGGVVVAADVGVVAAYGAPPGSGEAFDRADDLAAALRAVQDADIHVPPLGAWFEALGARDTGVRVLLHTRPRDARCLSTPSHETAEIQGPDDPLLDALPRGLRDEVRALDPFPPAFGALAGGTVVSVAYAFVRTERFSDLSIDTVRDFRRMGFGAAAAAALIRAEESGGRTVLWGARETNAASRHLARALDFVEVGVQRLGMRGGG